MHADAFYFRHLECYPGVDDEGIELCVRGGLIALALGRLSYAGELLTRPRVASWLADVYQVDAETAINQAIGLMRRHTRRNRLFGLLRDYLRG